MVNDVCPIPDPSGLAGFGVKLYLDSLSRVGFLASSGVVCQRSEGTAHPRATGSRPLYRRSLAVACRMDMLQGLPK